MADVPGSIGNPEIHDPTPDPPPVGRRLWERFSLSVLALLLLLLAQETFDILFDDYRRTLEIALWPLTAYLAFGLLAGFAMGMALVLPQRLEIRHPIRGLTLGFLPLAITGLNVTFAFAPTAFPDAMAELIFMLTGLRTFAMLLLGVAIASGFADE